MTEKVLVFPEHLLAEFNFDERVIKAGGDVNLFINTVLRPENMLFIDRDMAEESPEFKQIIPYVIIKTGDYIFRYRRSKKGGESRLHGLYSIGVGGHINPVDAGIGVLQDTYNTALQRELSEEIELQGNGTYRISILGCIYDNATSVGRVHFGIVHLLELDHPNFNMKTKDPALVDGGFMPVAYLKNHLEDFETWSSITLEHLL